MDARVDQLSHHVAASIDITTVVTRANVSVGGGPRIPRPVGMTQSGATGTPGSRLLPCRKLLPLALADT